MAQCANLSQCKNIDFKRNIYNIQYIYTIAVYKLQYNNNNIYVYIVKREIEDIIYIYIRKKGNNESYKYINIINNYCNYSKC